MQNDTASQAPAVSQNFPKFPIAANRLNDTPPSLNEKQRAAIELLVAGKSIDAVAKAVEVTRRTIYNWRQDDAFREELDRRRQELWSGAAERLRALVHPSLDIIEEQLRDPYDRARFRAASAVLRLSDLRKVAAPLESQ